MTEAISGDVLTTARAKRGDVVIEEGERGGVQFRTLCYLDVLLENDTITEAQASLAKTYWTMRELALQFLQAKTGRVFADYNGYDEQCEPLKEPEFPGLHEEFYFCIVRRIIEPHLKVLNLSCQTVGHPSAKYLMLQRFSEASIQNAFSRLQEVFDDAYNEATDRHKKNHSDGEKDIAMVW